MSTPTLFPETSSLVFEVFLLPSAGEAEHQVRAKPCGGRGVDTYYNLIVDGQYISMKAIVRNVLPTLFLFLSSTQSNIVIRDLGLYPVRKDDVGVVLYMTVVNTGQETYHLTTDTVRCCQIVTPQDTHCQRMDLVGGDMGSIPGGVHTNITFIFPTIFHVTRRDQCVLDMTYQGSSSGDVFTQSIAWETFINATSQGDLRIGFRSIAGSGTVDCPDKHYFSTAESCISVPTCSDHVSDFAYDPMSNSCCDLDGELSLQDLQQLPSFDPDSSWSSQDYINLQVSQTLDCHHGNRDDVTGFCVCDQGWTSVPFDRGHFHLRGVHYHMCNIELQPLEQLGSTLRQNRFIRQAFVTCSITLSLLVGGFMLHMAWRLFRSRVPRARYS